MLVMQDLFTLADYKKLPEGFPAQLIEGCLVKEPAAAFEHQNLAGRLRDILVRHVHADFVVAAPTDVVLDDHNVFQPDVVVLDRLPDERSHDVGIPKVAFEVLSPSTKKRDRHVKCPKLIEASTQEVWLLDKAEGSIEVWRADGMERVSGDDAVRSRAIDGFALVPSQVFRPPGAPG